MTAAEWEVFMSLDVFVMCNALFDLQASVDEGVLARLGLEKGSMRLIDRDLLHHLLPQITPYIVNREPGGSGANTAFGVALLGGKACFTSHVGADEFGDLYRQGLIARGVKANLGVEPGDTGVCAVLVTPDAQRTMATCLGRSRDLVPGDVDVKDLRSARYLYVTAYLWDTPNQKEAVLFALAEARRAGVRVAISLSDTFCVLRHRDELARLIQEYAHVVFGNGDEACELTGAGDVFAASEILADWVDTVVITLGAKGSLIRRASEVYSVPARAVDAIDTTGAGDMYAAGFLYGLARDLPLPECGRIGAHAAAEVVARMGPRLPSLDVHAIVGGAPGMENRRQT
jgi:sugar/nucleoside kinase (ribokinase family)